MIASHYAASLDRRVTSATPLLSDPKSDVPAVAELGPGDAFEMLDNSRGWAWGYGGPDRLVGYVRSEAVSG